MKSGHILCRNTLFKTHLENLAVEYPGHALLKSLQNIYLNSNFYKEARIVSFVSRLTDTIIDKIKAKVTLQSSISLAIKDFDQFRTLIT